MKLNIILTCDGGNGHKSAAEALRTEAIANGDAVEVINTTREGWFSGVNLGLPAEYDGFFHNGLIDLGPFATRWWDWAQRESQTELLRIFAHLRKLSFLSAPSFRHKTYHLLKDREDIDSYDEVIFHNTQPNCVQALISAIAKYNREAKADNQKKTVRLVNHFTDMPTLQAQMFIEEMAKIDVADLDDAQFELHTRPPIIEEDDLNLSPVEIDSIYHQRIKQLYPKLYQDVPPQKKRVFFVDGPIRKEFVQRKENPAKRCDGLSIQFTDQAEFDVLNQTLDNTLNLETSHATMQLKEDDEIVSIMLGSQASIEGTLGLVQEEIKIAEGVSKTKYVFVFCGANKPSEGLILYQQVLDIAQKVNVDPKYNIKIIPLTNQPASMIAAVYSLADRIITRPGGIYIMEIEAVVKRGKIFIFTELGQLEKLFNQFLSRSNETLKELFSQQKSQQRYADLIAWEEGNALHARNMCKDEYGRTRVVPVNVYTFQRELEFSNEKDAVTKLLVDKSYSHAFDQLMTNRELNIFFLTGHGVGVDLALLVEVTQLYDQISKELEDLIQRNSELEELDKGPKATLELVKQARDYITDNLANQALPSDILKDVPEQIKNITDSLQNSIHVVKQSNIENKSAIVRTLEFISRAFLNFFRSILGLNLDLSPEADLKKLNRDIREVIKRPMMDKVKPSDIDDVLSPIEPVSDVDASQWEELDKIISMIPAEEKNKTFEIKQSDYPQLKHNFLFCGSLEKDEPICFVIGKVLGQGGGGPVSFLQSRDGKPAVMKDHSVMRGYITEHKIESDCLKKMDMLIKGRHDSSDNISVVKYVPGETLHNYVQERKLLGLFTIYKSFKEEKKIKLSIALVTALKNVLEKGIVHGDIAPGNILIQEDGSDEIKATMIDFELSTMEHYPSLNFKPYISPYYGAPELRQAHSLDNEGEAQVYPYSDKSDIYSLGIILKDLGVASSLIKRMTDDDPEKRPDINEVLDILNDFKAKYSLDEDGQQGNDQYRP